MGYSGVFVDPERRTAHKLDVSAKHWSDEIEKAVRCQWTAHTRRVIGVTPVIVFCDDVGLLSNRPVCLTGPACPPLVGPCAIFACRPQDDDWGSLTPEEIDAILDHVVDGTISDVKPYIVGWTC